MADEETTAPPERTLTALEVAAVQMHELFTAYRTAGFTEKQALRLIAEIATLQHPKDSDERPE